MSKAMRVLFPASVMLTGILAVSPPTLAGDLVDPSIPSYQAKAIEFPKGASYVTPAGAIAIIGYNDMQGIMEALDSLFIAAHPGFKFELVLKGTKTAPLALTQGKSAFSPMGAEFTDADLASYRAVTGSDPILIRVAHDSLNPRALSSPLAIYVQQDNPLTSINLDQAARIFTVTSAGDEITRWGQLGLTGEWAQRPMSLCGLTANAALAIFIQRHKFGGRPFVSGLQVFPQSADAVKCVAKNPLSIGFATLNRAAPGAKLLAVADGPTGRPSLGSAEDIVAGRYPLDRYLYIYVRRTPGQPLDPFVREYLRLVLSHEGQEAIENEPLGYLPLNAHEISEELAKLN